MATKLSIKYWLKTQTKPEKNFVKLGLNEHSQWSNQMKACIQLINFDHLLQNKGTMGIARTTNSINKSISDRYENYFFKYIKNILPPSAKGNKKMKSYKLIKTEYKLEKYLTMNLNKRIIQQVCRFRISNHNLRIEQGRYENRGKNIFRALAVGRAITAPSTAGCTNNQRDVDIPEYTRELDRMVIQLIHAE